MKDTDGPRTEPDRFGRDHVAPRFEQRRGRGVAELGAPLSILRDAGTVAAAAIAERPVAWTLIAGALALVVWELSRNQFLPWPSVWVVSAVLIAAIACSAVVRDRRGLPAILAVFAAFAAVVGKWEDPSTLMTTAGAGAIAATLLLHGSPRALRIAGSVALALGCTFALWRAGWRVGQGPLAMASSVPAFRLASFRQEVVIAAGLAMLTPVVRPRLAAALVVSGGFVVSIDYFVVFGAASAYAVVAILSCGVAACCGAAVRVSGAAADDGALASGRLAGRLQRGAGIAGVLAGCVLIENVGWAAVLLRSVQAEGDVRTHWPAAVSGMEFACLTGLCARLNPRGAVFRVVAGLALASLAVAASAWVQPAPGAGPWQAAEAAISSAWWWVPIVATAAALAVRAPSWPRSTLVAGIAVATIGGTLHAVRVGLDDPWTAESAGPWLDYMATAVWCALGVLAASIPIGRAGAAALVVGAAVVTEVGSRVALNLASDGDIPLTPRWAELVWASAISLGCVLILRPFCARTPVPEHHPIHRDFDPLGRAA